MTNVVEVKNESELTEQIQNGTVIVDFYAPWCGPCKMIAPYLDAISTERTDVKVVKVNVDESIDLAKKFSIRGVPTLVVFENGEVKKSASGTKTKSQILEMIG